ncbi:uncharacterized protein ACLA_007210 [Aspergillus clavatus NRRL 1]|uniref:Myb-like domain-containing protein n=1 Tax=Aspergillus clavatus (strain ATCC 1007 / CBS 513.65 / DSM 816 / NCTC 3887 / NRRL 1 / QM 1276 / 107) TaxID=344612 RepID=A1CDN5_ASPCL|nr:uncharacterized protein ACLA_007210 [Aspergillus clavatus NRRL 1]EAW11962.1 conserved hypothetical protein [Aspergillus clavatus NRRL 1]
MSSSSVYEEDEEGSESDVEARYSSTKLSASSPRNDEYNSYNSAEPEGNTPPEVLPRASRGTRAQILDTLRTSLGIEAVNAYTNVLAETADSTVSSDVRNENYNATQNGVVIWTPQEKETLFNILDKKSKNGIPEIAQAIGSKSELEVQQHLKLLHKGLERQHLRDRHSRTIIIGDVSAALEISQECCRALEDYAELLSLEEQRAEDVAGRKIHQDVWVVDRDVATMVDEQLEAQDETPLPSSSVYVTGELFNLGKWIRLSERFFMNSGGPRLEENWVNIACADEAPSMTADALADFYALTISVTRRLVQSTLFFAASRLRNMRETGNRKARVVRSRDVKTALDVLNMTHDRFDFWVGLARRCRLQVADLRHKKGWQSQLMDYNEVEDLLSGKVPFNGPSDERDSRSRSGSQSSHEDADESMDDHDSESAVSSSASSLLSSPELSPVDEPFLDLEDEHAEKIDQKNNSSEELSLWNLMGQSAPQDIESLSLAKEEESKSCKPAGERKLKEDLVDWRDRTLYRSEWEEYGHDIHDLHEDLSENRRKRRRLESYAMAEWSAVVRDERDDRMDDMKRLPELDPNTMNVEQSAERIRGDGDPDGQFEHGNDAMDIDDSDSNESILSASEEAKMRIEMDRIRSPDHSLKNKNIRFSYNQESTAEDESDGDDDQRNRTSLELRHEAEVTPTVQEVPEAVVKPEVYDVNESEEDESGYESDSDAFDEGIDTEHKLSPHQSRSGGVSLHQEPYFAVKEEGIQSSNCENSKLEPESASGSDYEEDIDFEYKPAIHPRNGTEDGDVPMSPLVMPPFKKENIKSSQSGESGSEYETESEVGSEHNSDIHRKVVPEHAQIRSQPDIKPELEQSGTESDSYLDHNGSDSDSDSNSQTGSQHGIKLDPHSGGSHPASDIAPRESPSGSDSESEGDSSGDENFSTGKRSRQSLQEHPKIEPKMERAGELSSSDDELPFQKRLGRGNSGSSSDEDDEKKSLPFHSEPLSPVT